MSKNQVAAEFGHVGSDEEQQRDLYTFEGTTNVAFIMEDGIFVGVDSRASRIKSGDGYQKGDLADKEQDKFAQISNNIYVTMCGNAGVNISLCKYLQENYQEKQSDVKTVAENALMYLKSAHQEKEDYVANFVVGYRNETPKCYKVNCKLERPRKIFDKGAIGSGASCLKSILDRHENTLNPTAAIELAKLALTMAALFHPGTGSYLKVYHIFPSGEHEMVWKGLALDNFYNMFDEFETVMAESKDIAGALFFVSTADHKVSGVRLSGAIRRSDYCKELVTAVPIGEFGSPSLPSGFFLYVVFFKRQGALETVLNEADLMSMVEEGTEDSFGEFKKLGFESRIDFDKVLKPLMVVNATKTNLKLLTQPVTRNEDE